MSHQILVGGPNIIASLNPFQNTSTFRSHSLCVTPVEFLNESGADSGKSGTGFFWTYDNQTYLITNWHNVSGKNPFDLQLLDQTTAFVPAKLRIYLPRADFRDGKFLPIPRIPYVVDLYVDYHEPIWLEHPKFDEMRIDVVAIPLRGVPLNKEWHVNAHQSLNLMHLVGADVYVVGFPFRNYTGIMLPIWKRGSFATEPLWPIDQKPMFLIDATTRSGMSGSPIFRHQFGPATTADGTIHAANILTTQFIGVYAGHLGDRTDQIGIGFGWYGSLVDEIVATDRASIRR